jgi:hypothetical protein
MRSREWDLRLHRRNELTLTRLFPFTVTGFPSHSLAWTNNGHTPTQTLIRWQDPSNIAQFDLPSLEWMEHSIQQKRFRRSLKSNYRMSNPIDIKYSLSSWIADFKAFNPCRMSLSRVPKRLASRFELVLTSIELGEVVLEIRTGTLWPGTDGICVVLIEIGAWASLEQMWTGLLYESNFRSQGSSITSTPMMRRPTPYGRELIDWVRFCDSSAMSIV